MHPTRGQTTLPHIFHVTLASGNATHELPRMLIEDYRIAKRIKRWQGQRRGWRPRLLAL